MDTYASYHTAVAFLESLTNLSIPTGMAPGGHPELFLKRVRYFLNILGNPDRGLNIVHVGGTAGKGTVANLIHAMLTENGSRAGLFTSPFATTTIETIKVGEQYIAPDEFARLVDRIKPALDGAHRNSPYGMPSYFEIMLALALLYFKEKKCTWAVLEVGLGGRYDATNVIRHPRIVALTTIGYDHTDVLGTTLSEIARNKADIIKRGARVFSHERRAKLLDIFQAKAKRVGARFTPVAWAEHPVKRNRSLAIAIARELGISETAIRNALVNAKLPCRFEIMERRPLIILDGAHSPVKMESMAHRLKALSIRKLHVVLAMARDKDIRVSLRHVVPLAHTVYATRFLIASRRCAHPNAVAHAARYWNPRATAQTFLDPYQALAAARKAAQRDDIILVTGSFFLAGELRTLWYPEEYILKRRKSF